MLVKGGGGVAKPPGQVGELYWVKRRAAPQTDGEILRNRRAAPFRCSERSQKTVAGGNTKLMTADIEMFFFSQNDIKEKLYILCQIMLSLVFRRFCIDFIALKSMYEVRDVFFQLLINRS